MKLFKFLFITAVDVALKLFIGLLIILTAVGLIGVIFNTTKELIQ